MKDNKVLFLKYLLICNAIICTAEATKISAIDEIVLKTEDFFSSLKSHYVYQQPTIQIKKQIDQKIDEYLQNSRQWTINRRRRTPPRHYGYNSGNIGMMEKFEDLTAKEIPDTLDITFFRHNNSPTEVIWFAALMNPERILLFQLNGYVMKQVDSYPLKNGVQILSGNSDYTTLLVVHTNNDKVIILRLGYENGKYMLGFAQELNCPHVTDLKLWRGMNQLYLGIASHDNTYIYTWLGGNFDKSPNLPFGAHMLTPFRSGGSMYLAIAGVRTFVLKFSLRSNKFSVIQTLPRSVDVSSVHIESGPFGEHFLSLSNAEATTIYKQVQDRMVPFQRIASADKTISLIVKGTILLYLLKNEEMMIYQYDGWRFVQLGLRIPKIINVHLANIYGERLLLMKDTNFRWTLRKPQYMRKKGLRTSRNDLKNWCLQASEKINGSKLIVERDIPKAMYLTKGSLYRLQVNHLNNHERRISNAQSLLRNVQIQLNAQKQSLRKATLSENTIFRTLNATKVILTCSTKCTIKNLATVENNGYLSKLKRLTNTKQNLKLQKIRVDYINNLRCPMPGFHLKNIIVKNLINRISLYDLLEETLKISGDQQLESEVIFGNLSTAKAFLPTLDITTSSTRQNIRMKKIILKDLNLTEGGILLPLNRPSSEVAGSVTAARVRIKNAINLRAGIRGNGLKGFAPLQSTSGNFRLDGNYSFNNINVVKLVAANDITRQQGKSFTSISRDLTRINENVGVHLTFSQDKTHWNNVSVGNPLPWVTLRKPAHSFSNITATKLALQAVELTESSFGNLPLQRLEVEMCGSSTSSPETKMSTVTMDNLYVPVLRTTHLLGAKKFTDIITDSVISLKHVNSSLKDMVTTVATKNLSVSVMSNLDFKGLQAYVRKWNDKNQLQGSFTTANLNVASMKLPNGLDHLLPNRVNNVVLKGILYAENINGYNVLNIFKDTVDVQKLFSSSAEITFKNGFHSNNIRAISSPILFRNWEDGFGLGVKILSNYFSTEVLVLPFEIAYPPTDISINLLIKGSAKFSTEPVVHKLNKKELHRIYNTAWLNKESTILTGSSISIKKMSLHNSTKLIEDIGILQLGSRKTLFSLLMNKVKSQNITVEANFDQISAREISAVKSSKLTCLVPQFNDLVHNTLRRKKFQMAIANWHFNEVYTPGDLVSKGKINNMNLQNGVIRQDENLNVVKGKKIVLELWTQSIRGCGFGKWSRNVFSENTSHLIRIAGRKAFNQTEISSLSITGTIMDRNISEAVLKSSTQITQRMPTIHGTVKTPRLITDNVVNNINLTDLAIHQLKKRKPLQRIKSPAIFQNNLKVLGNLKINGFYDNVEFEHWNKIANVILPLSRYAVRLRNLADIIDITLEGRAQYWTKYETVERHSFSEKSNVDKKEQSRKIVGKRKECQLQEDFLICGKKSFDASSVLINTSETSNNRLISFGDHPLRVSIGPNAFSVYSVNRSDGELRLNRLLDLKQPGIIDGSTIPERHNLWIVLRLPSQLLLYRVEPSLDFQRYNIPGSSAFLLSSGPSSEILLLRPHDVWKLEGLAGPVSDPRYKLLSDTIGFLVNYKSDQMLQNFPTNVTLLLGARYLGN